jgi:hypothetical protein
MFSVTFDILTDTCGFADRAAKLSASGWLGRKSPLFGSLIFDVLDSVAAPRFARKCQVCPRRELAKRL